MFFKFAQVVMRAVLFFSFRIKVYGIENMPKEGGMLVAINHRSLWDVPVVGAYMPRQLGFMAKSELFKGKMLNKLFTSLGAFPVHRGKGDIGAIKAALKRLKNGEIVAIFPEGKRVKNNENVSAKPGAVMLASRANVPVLPIRIIGGYKWMSKVSIVVGKPVFYDEYYNEKLSLDKLQELSDKLMYDLKELKP